MSDDGPWIDFDGDNEGDEYTSEELDGGGTAYTSEDGEVAYDYDGDGLIDELDVDTDGDGVNDTTLVDTDGDGYMDEEVALEEEPATDDTTTQQSSGFPLGYLGG